MRTWMMVIGGIGVLFISFFGTLRALQYFGPEGRDSRRREDVTAIARALTDYAQRNGSYVVKDAGADGIGVGFAAVAYGNKSIIHALSDSGYLKTPIADDPQKPNYMVYVCDGGQRFSVSATLESPDSGELADAKDKCNGTGPNGTVTAYGKNFAIGN